ncbi:UDP-N-acetylmuramoyl-L-alanine--D-glutamate ligase [Microvirga antarctica]|uniref:UDP-N-acetylmuramoyl-L-alanine--D-glutamate ligase n=1 Tax=Microvirga antarctica TaxID=2819233 RepID=UPI001B315DC9|nr:UDP-N-acetylmuramoyl-L-alanine--D-glutamate ligase [Microvirga antarctica]
MTPITTLSGRTVALFGLGGSGLVTALALKAGGAHVVAWDDNPARTAQAEADGIAVEDLRKSDWSRFSSFILSPGVPLTHPTPHWSVDLAQAAGVEIIGDIELFCRERASIAPNAPFIAITGTNGKSTTTALVSHILREAGRDVQMGGNIGTAILSLLPPSDDRVHVIECSSFQIDLAPSLAPSIGVMLNVSADHLDRHGTLDAYAAIKERLIRHADKVVIGVDDAISRAMAAHVRVPTLRVGLTDKNPGSVFGQSHQIIANTDGDAVAIADLAGISSLRGDHNAQNAAAAVAIALFCQVDTATIDRALHTFPGLPHRMEEIGRRGDVLFINDSKATNADSTEKALKSFDDIFWILGGKSKEGGIAPLRPHFGKVRKAYLIGAASDEYAATLGDSVLHQHCSTLDRAVQQAAQDAAGSTHAVVLLSPASASYDQYPNFEVRGNHFRELVKALPGLEPAMGA